MALTLKGKSINQIESRKNVKVQVVEGFFPQDVGGCLPSSGSSSTAENGPLILGKQIIIFSGEDDKILK